MKKLLTLISALGMTTTGIIGAADVVSCSKKDKDSSKVTSFKLKEGYKITVQIKGDSTNAFSDTPAGEGDSKLITATFIVKSQNDSLKEDGEVTLDSVLSEESATFMNKDSSNLVELVFNSIKNNTKVKQQVKMEDITAFVEIGSIFDNNLGDIDVPVWIYGLEHVDFSTSKQDDKNKTDRSSDIAKINDNIFAKINEKINDEAIKLSADNAEVKYIAKPADQYVPPKATIKMKANSGSKVLGLAGDTEVEFTLQQNIQPSGFDLNDTDKGSNAAKYESTDATENQPSSANAKLTIKEGKSVALISKNADVKKWEVGEDKDISIDKTNVSVTMSGGGISIGGLKVGNANLNFHKDGFKPFTIVINVVKNI